MIRVIDEDVVIYLRKRAKGNQRSLEAEAQTILSDAADRAKQRARGMRELRKSRRDLSGFTITEDSTDIIREDRDSR